MRPRVWGPILLIITGIATAPFMGEAQRIVRVGYLVLSPLADPPSAERAAFVAGLRDLGYVEGRNLVIEYRSANWNRELLADLADALVALKVDVIIAVPGAHDAAMEATKTVPIVVPAAGQQIVTSLARPGGNVTGTAWTTTSELASKQLQLVKEAIPKASRIVLLWNPATQDEARVRKETQAAARALGVALQSVEVRDPKDVPIALTTLSRKPPDALITLLDPLTSAYRPIIIDFAMKQRVPTMFGLREDVAAGGLMSYAANGPEVFRRAAVYVDRILKGAKAGDLPMEQPREFEFVVNLKTAQALRLTLPPSLLLRATAVIE